MTTIYDSFNAFMFTMIMLLIIFQDGILFMDIKILIDLIILILDLMMKKIKLMTFQVLDVFMKKIKINSYDRSRLQLYTISSCLNVKELPAQNRHNI